MVANCKKKETLHAFKPALPLMPCLYCHRSGSWAGPEFTVSVAYVRLCGCCGWGQLQWFADSVTLVSLEVTKKDGAHPKGGKRGEKAVDTYQYLSYNRHSLSTLFTPRVYLKKKKKVKIACHEYAQKL